MKLLDVSAHAVENAYEIEQNLKRQLTGPVKWVDTVLLMERVGVDCFFEVGPKNVLKALVEKISRNVEIDSVKVVPPHARMEVNHQVVYSPGMVA